MAMRNWKLLGLAAACFFVGATARSGVIEFDFAPTAVENILKQARAAVVTLDVPPAPTAPALDGQLNDPAWQAAPSVTIPGGPYDAIARFRYDASNLYIGV